MLDSSNRIGTHRIAALFTALMLLAAFATPSHALIVAHNGTANSLPPGTGDVSVVLSENQDGSIGKTFFAPDLHVLVNNYPAGAAGQFFAENVGNATTESWIGYIVQVGFGDIYGFTGAPVPDVDAVTQGGTFAENKAELVSIVGTVGVDSSFVARAADSTTLFISFSDPVDPNEIFGLAFNVQSTAPGLEGFVLQQQPIPADNAVPEPATAGLGFMAMAAVGLGVLRRRKA